MLAFECLCVLDGFQGVEMSVVLKEKKIKIDGY